MEKNHKSRNTFPIFHSSARTLQEMATSRFAYACWCSVIINKRDSRSDSRPCWGHNLWFEKHTFSCTDILPVPFSIRPKIDYTILLIGKELEMWTNHNNFRSVSIPREVIVDCVVFDSDNICYKKTAKNLLTKANPAFCLIDQFHIACKYNLEEDIERLWPLVKDFVHIEISRFNYSATSIQTIEYWCSRMRGELLQVYGYRARSPEFYVLQRQTTSDERPMMDWSEIEYFWKKLSIEEQTYLVQDYRWLQDFIEHLIWNMDNAMLETVAKSQPIILLKHLASDELYYEYTLQVWDYMKNSFIDDKQTFYRILIDLSEMAFCLCGYSHVATLLKEIWLSAPDELKIYICYYRRFGEVLDFVEGQRLVRSIMQFVKIRSFGCDISFFIELSRDCSFETRQRIWLKWWHKFVILAQVPDLLEMMSLCFDNANDLAVFKKTTMLDTKALEYVCDQFIDQGLDDELDEYLKLCCSDDDDEKRVNAVREKIVLENEAERAVRFVVAEVTEFQESSSCK
ncbi:uncharacterized protein LOC135843587 [Planococcus citri]|uniref:uncharacterized protein LOC135843587 n=1 Tax=Planococcus citri TaxID=170843 RepID=UPI0031F85142